MSKNIYRVNKKSDLDEIMKNNFLKPIFIIFVSKSIDKKLYDEIALSLKTISKQLTYSMILIIDFDDFIDNMNFFTTIKENVPHFISYFKGKQISSCNEKNNFIPLIISLMDQIHNSYVTRLMNAFNQSNQQKIDDNENNNNDNNNAINKENSINKENTINEKQKVSKEVSKEVDKEIEEEESESEEEESDSESEVEETTNKTSNKIIEVEDNVSEEIRAKKEKLKELKKLKDMLNKK